MSALSSSEGSYAFTIVPSASFLTGEQKDWVVPPAPADVKRLARAYRTAALGDLNAVFRQLADLPKPEEPGQPKK